MKTVQSHQHIEHRPGGFALVYVLIVVLILMIVGFAVIKIAEGDALRTVLFQNESIAMSNAEAAYEKAIFWMSDNPDLLLDMDVTGTSGTLTFPNSRADYTVKFYGFVGYRPVFEVTADGYCGSYHRSIRVYVAQAVSGWEMGMCRVPTDGDSTTPVYFVDDETVDMPIHINTYDDPKDAQRDIFISGSPVFLKLVSMEEARLSSGSYDKYQDVIQVFTNGISFEQPRSLISDEDSVNKKIKWYEKTIKEQRPDLVLKPQKNNSVPQGLPAVQLEFFVGTNGRGYVRITDDCTVKGYISTSACWDYKVKPGSDASAFEKYPIYGYHYIPRDSSLRVARTIESIQITADYGGHQAPPCGMIYVDGNMVIGSAAEHAAETQIGALNVVQGKVAVIATGNIWIADSIMVSDRGENGTFYPRQDDGMPHLENPNALALFAAGVIKIIDPGMVEQLTGSGGPPSASNLDYEPVGLKDHRRPAYPDYTWHRHLPDPLVVEAAITVGGGGWGAEHVKRQSGFSWPPPEERKEQSGRQDDLIVRGTLSEVTRGVVGLSGEDGYLKQYYFDRRMLSGLIPGSVRLKGKFVTVPGGWNDFRVDTKPQN